LPERTKIAWLYLVASLFVATGLYLIVQKDNYFFFAFPVVLGILLLYLFSLDKVILLISFLVPLSVNLENIDAGLSISLPVEPLLFGVLLLFISKLLYERNYDKKIAKHPITIIIYVMLLWMFITTFTSELPLVSVKYLVSRLWFVVPFFFVAALVFKKIKNFHKFIWFYIASLIIVIIYTISRHAGFGFSENTANWVMTPFYNDHTAYGSALAMYLIFSAGYLFYPGLKPIQRLAIIAVTGALVLAIVLSLSRAAWISLAASLVVLMIVILKIKFRWILLGFVSIIFVFITFEHEIIDTLEKNKQDSSNDLVEHVQSISNISSDASNLERINRWQAAFRLFDERPLFGWGPGTYQFVYGPLQRSKEKTIISTNSGDKGNAHSEYIGPLSEMGLPGMLIVFMLVGTLIYTGLKTFNRSKSKEVKVITMTTTLALVSYFVHGLLNNFLDTDKLSIPVWGCAAILVVMDLYYADKESITKDTRAEEVIPNTE
jgi:O-antigen ligase